MKKEEYEIVEEVREYAHKNNDYEMMLMITEYENTDKDYSLEIIDYWLGVVKYE